MKIIHNSISGRSIMKKSNIEIVEKKKKFKFLNKVKYFFNGFLEYILKYVFKNRCKYCVYGEEGVCYHCFELEDKVVEINNNCGCRNFERGERVK